MIELFGFAYAAGKDLVNYLAWNEVEPKLVDMAWLERPEVKDGFVKGGYELCWSKPEKVERRLLEGYEIVYEVDKVRRTRRRIKLRDKAVLLRQKKMVT